LLSFVSLDLIRRALILLVALACVAPAASRETDWLAILRRWRPQYFGKGASVRGPVDYAALESQWIEGQKRAFGAGSQVYFTNVRYFERIRQMLQPGDVVVFYRMDDRSFNQTGWAIIRAGKVIYSIHGPIVN
jgi:hypothetical protein